MIKDYYEEMCKRGLIRRLDPDRGISKCIAAMSNNIVNQAKILGMLKNPLFSRASAWDATLQYKPLDVVIYNNELYSARRCKLVDGEPQYIEPEIGKAPDNILWFKEE